MQVKQAQKCMKPKPHLNSVISFIHSALKGHHVPMSGPRAVNNIIQNSPPCLTMRSKTSVAILSVSLRSSENPDVQTHLNKISAMHSFVQAYP